MPGSVVLVGMERVPAIVSALIKAVAVVAVAVVTVVQVAVARRDAGVLHMAFGGAPMRQCYALVQTRTRWVQMASEVKRVTRPVTIAHPLVKLCSIRTFSYSEG